MYFFSCNSESRNVNFFIAVDNSVPNIDFNGSTVTTDHALDKHRRLGVIHTFLHDVIGSNSEYT